MRSKNIRLRKKEKFIDLITKLNLKNIDNLYDYEKSFKFLAEGSVTTNLLP